MSSSTPQAPRRTRPQCPVRPRSGPRRHPPHTTASLNTKRRNEKRNRRRLRCAARTLATSPSRRGPRSPTPAAPQRHHLPSPPHSRTLVHAAVQLSAGRQSPARTRQLPVPAAAVSTAHNASTRSRQIRNSLRHTFTSPHTRRMSSSLHVARARSLSSSSESSSSKARSTTM